MGDLSYAEVLRKVPLIIAVLKRNPIEFRDRIANFLEVQLEFPLRRPGVYEPQEWGEVIADLNLSISSNLDAFLDEPACAEILAVVRSRISTTLLEAPFALGHNADFSFARIGYALCRALRPSVVLETGVAYGVSSAFMLKALEANNAGILHSIDLPPLARAADRYVGILIPEALRHRWRLHRGVSKRILPSLLRQLGRVDIFAHDSLHTHKNMLCELEMVTPYLSRPGVVIADDVDNNSAFLEWVQGAYPDFWATLNEVHKNTLFGVSVFL